MLQGSSAQSAIIANRTDQDILGRTERQLELLLPDHLLELLLSFLPSSALPAARLVCKQWLRCLTSVHFVRLWASRPRPHSIWIVRHCTQTACHVASRLSLRLPLRHHYQMLSSCHVGILVTSPDCLLSLITSTSRSPFPIPPPLSISSVLHIGLAGTSLGFQIMVHGADDSGCQQVELYDSSRASWTRLPPPPLFPQRTSRHHPPRGVQDFVYWNGVFCIVSSDQILTYSPRGAKWDTVKLPTLPRIWDARFVTLHVMMRGSLILEGNFQEQGDFTKRYPLRVGILEFVPATRTWKEVAFMPKDLSDRLCKGQVYPAHSFYTAHSDPDSETLCFAPFPSDYREDVMTFDLGKRQWSCVSMRHTSNDHLSPLSIPHFKGLTYHPGPLI